MSDPPVFAYCPDHDTLMDYWLRADGTVWWLCDHCGSWRDEDVPVKIPRDQ